MESERQLKIVQTIERQMTGGYDSVERPCYYHAVQSVIGNSMGWGENYIEQADEALAELIRVATQARERLQRENDQPTLF